MATRRSLTHILGGGLIEIVAIGALIFLVSGGRLHHGQSASAEPGDGPSSIAEWRDSWTAQGDVTASELPSPWSWLPWNAPDGNSAQHAESHEHAVDHAVDEQFVERQLTQSAEALKRWLRRQFEEAVNFE